MSSLGNFLWVTILSSSKTIDFPKLGQIFPTTFIDRQFCFTCYVSLTGGLVLSFTLISEKTWPIHLENFRLVTHWCVQLTRSQQKSKVNQRSLQTPVELHQERLCPLFTSGRSVPSEAILWAFTSPTLNFSPSSPFITHSTTHLFNLLIATIFSTAHHPSHHGLQQATTPSCT